MFLLGQQQTLCRALSIWGRAGDAFPLLLAPTMRKPRPGNELKGDELVLVRRPERLEARPRQAVSFGQASLSPGRAAGGPGAWLQRRPPCSRRGQRCPADVRVPGGRSVPLAAQHAFYFVLALALFAPPSDLSSLLLSGTWGPLSLPSAPPPGPYLVINPCCRLLVQ